MEGAGGNVLRQEPALCVANRKLFKPDIEVVEIRWIRSCNLSGRIEFALACNIKCKLCNK